MSSKGLKFALALAAAAAFSIPMWGQGSPAVKGVVVRGLGTPAVNGLVNDWSDRHLVFSNPGTERDAIWNGTHDSWLKVVNDPRYIMQQIKRNTPSHGQSFGAPGVHRDWAVSLGAGQVAQNMYPAKFTWDINATPNCTNDFVVYGLNHTGTAGGQANLVALNNLYEGTGGLCGTGTASYYWAYNATTHSGTVTTSPVLSQDGTEVMYIESGTSGSYLHILKWKSADHGTPIASVAPANAITNASMSTCGTGGTGSCVDTITLSTTTGHTITYSSPFYDYTNDILYVGDDDGTLYKVTPVLKGTTAPAVTSLVVLTGEPLTSPVYDSGSGNVFVGAEYYLYAVKGGPGVALALQTHPQLTVGYVGTCSGHNNNYLYDGPIVDSGNGWVYEWVTDLGTGTGTLTTNVIQAHTAGTNSPSGTSWTITASPTVGNGNTTCNSAGFFPTHIPTFDNNYYAGTVTTGHMWVCGRSTTSSDSMAEIWEIPTSGTNGQLATTATAFAGLINSSANYVHAQCSPMTEIYNGSTDYIFVGEGCVAGGVGCTDALGDLYGFKPTDPTNGSAPTATALTTYATPTAAGGTSGIVVDNVSGAAQASSIYFTTQATSTTVCGSTAAYCAIKLTQAALN